MAGKFRFEKFDVWQDSRKFVSHIYQITKNFPSEEKFGLVDQIRRAAISISLNIAEGSDRRSDIEFRRYLRMAAASGAEVISALYIALDLHYLNQTEFDLLYTECSVVVAKLGSFIKKLSSGN
ncbi:MAG: four helix bundle protein [Candidatus Daviesbacteria bacterium]|nr:four helix bundle protein [Candidatus Daviesbacteria bacterium]